MSLLLAATIATGVLLDKAMLALGFGTMGWRYALSVLGAYGAFFLLVRMWVWYAAGVAPSLTDSMDEDAAETAAEWLPGPGRSGGSALDTVRFEGGDSGGAGASDAFDVVASADSGGGGSGGGLDFDGGGDEFWVLVVIAVVLAVICGAGAYVIFAAPQILPEVALEAALGAGMLKKLNKEEPGWAGRLLRRTWIPLLVVLVMAFFAGRFIQWHCPTATSARAALHCAVTQ